MITTVNVTIREDDVLTGIRGSCKFCPASLALIRALDEQYPDITAKLFKYHVSTCKRVTYVIFQSKSLGIFRADNPIELQSFVDRFDRCWTLPVSIVPLNVSLRFREMS